MQERRGPTGRVGPGPPTSAMRSPSTRRPDGLQHVGRVAASQVDPARPRRDRAGRRAVHQRHGRARGRPGPVRPDLRRAGQDDHGRHGLQACRGPLLVDHELRLGPRLVPAGRVRPGPRRGGRGRTAEMPHLQVQGPRRARCCGPITEGADIDTLRYFRFITEGVKRRRRPLLAVADRLLGRAGLRALLPAEDAPELWNAVLRAGEPHGMQADRPVGDRDAADRIRTAVPRHRLLPARDRPIRGPARQRHQARQAAATSSGATRSGRSPTRARRGC